MTEVFRCGKEGFKSIFKSDSWQIASISYGEQYSKEGFNHMKRHKTTDEAFILLCGTAILHTCENGEFSAAEMEKNKIYVIRKNTWHYLCVSCDALIAVIENGEVLPCDTERMEINA